MNATKRKFNALLQGLATNSSRPTSADDASTTRTPSTAMAASDGPPAASSSGGDSLLLQKRRRLGLQGAAIPGGGLPPAKPSITSTVVRRLSSRVDGSRKDRGDAPAKYSPTDRQELLRRLATFQELTDWSPKPERVSEIEWAKRGWVCQGKERVRCVLCHKELVVKFNRKDIDGSEVAVLVPSEVEEALVDKYADLVVTAHQEECLWRKRGCDDSLLRLPLASASASLGALRSRYDELCTRKPFLPYEFNLRLPNDMSIDEVLSQLPPTFFSDPPPAVEAPPAESPNRVALALALIGWQGLSNARIGAVPNSASCHSCLRRLGLWMFKSKEVDDAGQVLVSAPMDHLDPAREHRFFCPWQNAKAQSRGGAQSGHGTHVPGWKALLQTVANEAHLRGVYEGRSRVGEPSRRGVTGASSTPVRGPADVQVTPSRDTPVAAADADPPHDDAEPGDVEEDEQAREAKDKERWARLRRVKSLFDSKSARKLRQSLSRPGTSHSTRSGRSAQDKE